MSWPSLKTLGAILAAIALVLLGARAAKKKGNARKKEAREQQYLADGSSKSLQKAKKLKESAQKDIDASVAAHDEMAKKLEALGEGNEDLDELMDRFNSDRVRRKSTRPTS